MDTPSLVRSVPPLLLGDDGDVVMGSEGRPFALPTGTVTFLLADVEGSTKRWEAEPEAMAMAIARHYEILERAISDAGGVRPVEQGDGDSVVGAFSRASDAVAAAVTAQRALAAEVWPEGAELGVRMAVHTGEAQLRDEGNHFGQAIIRCARPPCPPRSGRPGSSPIRSRTSSMAIWWRHDVARPRRPWICSPRFGVARTCHSSTSHSTILEAARTHALELRTRCEWIDAPYIDTVVDLVLGECAWPDDLDEALASAHRSLVRAAEYGLWPSAVDSLEAIRSMVIAGGRACDGARLLAAAQTGRDSMGYVYRFAHRARYVAEATAIACDDDGWDEGAGLMLPAAVDLARRMRGERVRSTVGWGSLTPTELAVVEQVSAGLTNPQIAERLLMGRATVKTHLLHAFAKLGVGSRAELTAAAIRRQRNANDIDTNHDGR